MQQTSLSLEEYQKRALETAIYPSSERVVYPILGIVGEAGELANKYKKVLRDDNSLLTSDKKEDLIKELGDVLWYCAALANDLGTNLNEVAQLNLEKLYKRKENGTIKGSGDNR